MSTPRDSAYINWDVKACYVMLAEAKGATLEELASTTLEAALSDEDRKVLEFIRAQHTAKNDYRKKLKEKHQGKVPME